MDNFLLFHFIFPPRCLFLLFLLIFFLLFFLCLESAEVNVFSFVRRLELNSINVPSYCSPSERDLVDRCCSLASHNCISFKSIDINFPSGLYVRPSRSCLLAGYYREKSQPQFDYSFILPKGKECFLIMYYISIFFQYYFYLFRFCFTYYLFYYF